MPVIKNFKKQYDFKAENSHRSQGAANNNKWRTQIQIDELDEKNENDWLVTTPAAAILSIKSHRASLESNGLPHSNNIDQIRINKVQ